MSTDGRLLIAEFARRCRLPISTLRYYDRVGLLRPAEVDPHSGYRRYGNEQLADAVIIARLRAIGSSPDTIADVLAGGRARAAALASERERLTAEIRNRTHALASLEQLVSPPVTTPQRVHLLDTEVPALPFTSTAVELPAAVKRGIATLRSRLRHHNLAATQWGALLPLDLSDDLTGHVFAHLDSDVEPHGLSGLDLAVLPGGDAFRITHQAPYDSLAYAYHTLLDAIDHAQTIPRAPIIERYPVEPNMARTEITVLTDSDDAASYLPCADQPDWATPSCAHGTDR